MKTASHLLKAYLEINQKKKSTAQAVVSTGLKSQEPVVEPTVAISLSSLSHGNQHDFSACVMLKADSEIQLLPEWIAYHYHTLQLRSLIVAVDPNMQKSPLRILDKWRTFGMEIQEWRDDNFLSKNKTGTLPWDPNEDDGEDHFQWFRRDLFLDSCVQEFIQKSKIWFTHLDVNEFIVMHPRLRRQDEWRKLVLQPAIVPNWIPQFLEEAVAEYAKALHYPCLSMPRLLFGSVEEDSSAQRIVHGLNATKLETMRWKYHSSYDNDRLANGPAKVLIDLSKLPVEGGIHKPGLCRDSQLVTFAVKSKFPLTVNHYIGARRYANKGESSLEVSS
jgi:hypothetical protein